MKSAKVLYKIAFFIIALMVAVFTVGYAFAWFLDRKDDAEFSITGKSAGAYFESGTGTETNPFIISNTTHMHNLAVLQNTGKLDQKYYYEIKKGVNIDMSGRYIPPIGNDAHPFIGDFNGNGQSLANLNVTTNKTLLKDEYPAHARPAYEFSQAVGLFGMTGASSEIHNVILDNPSVDVSATDTLYSSTEGAYAGLAIGLVNGKASSIGVRALNEGSTLDVKVAGYSTFNSILGALGDGVTSSVTGGGHGQGGSGASFGATFDVASMLSRLEKIEINKKSDTPSYLLPDIDEKNDYPTPASGAKIAFSVDESASTYTGANAAEVIAKNNVGYFLGNQNKINVKQLNFGNPLIQPESEWSDWYTEEIVSGQPVHQSPEQSGKVPAWFYTYDDYISTNDGTVYSSGTGFRALTDAEFEDLPENLKNVLPEAGEQKTFTTIRISQSMGDAQNWGSLTNNQWSYHGQISWMGRTYGKGFRGADGTAVDENGNTIEPDVIYDEDGKYVSGDYYVHSGAATKSFNSYTGGIALPNNAVWFKPAQLGKFRFIMFADKNGQSFVMRKITRKLATPDNPFATNPTVSDGSDVTLETIIQQKLPQNVFFYYEHEVTQEELAAGNVEYLLQMYDSSGAFFIYLDIGASATDDVSSIDREKSVSAVDFIYDGVEIEQTDEILGVGNFIVSTSGEKALYQASRTSIWFENITKVLNMVYLRLNGDTGSNEGHSDHNGKTICLVGSTEGEEKTAISTNSEVKATFATYVCPTIGGGSGTVSGGGGSTTSPSISGSSLALMGSTLQLRANNFAGTVTWSSSNTSVATVNSDGLVTPVAEGTTVITATDGTASVTKTINVIMKNVAVTGISLNKTSLNLTAGASETLTATIEPADATNTNVTWSSGDVSVATVDNNGKVTAVAAGTATITVTTADGSFTATCEVTVEAAQTAYHYGTFTFTANSASASPDSTGKVDGILTNNGAAESGGTWTFSGNAQTVNLALNVEQGKVITISIRGKRNSDKAQGINVYEGSDNLGKVVGTIDLTSTEAEGASTVQYTATSGGIVNLALGRSAGGGTALTQIVVTISDGAGTPDPTPTVSGISIAGAPTEMTVSDTATLTAAVTMSDGSTYAGNVEWTSDAEDVATVADGVVTAKTAGSVTITATAGGKTATCTITVKAATPAGTVITYTPSGTSLIADKTSTSSSLTLNGGGFEAGTASWSGTINGEEKSYTSALRPAGSGRYLEINVAAGTKVSVAFGGNYGSNNTTGKIWFGAVNNTAEADAIISGTSTNSGKNASGLLEWTFDTDGTYYLLFDGSKPSIFAVVITEA